MTVRTVLLASVCAVWVLLPTAGSGRAIAATPTAVQLASDAYKSLSKGELAQAIADYSTAIESRELPVETLANALLNRGLAYQRNGDTDKAIDDYTTALGIDAMGPELRARALYNRGLAYQLSTRPALAIEDFTGALFLDPEFSYAYYGRGNVLRDSGQYLFALSDFEKAIRYKYPQPYLAHYGEALAHEALNRPEDEKRALMQVLAENPNFDPARKKLAALGGIVPLLPVNAEAVAKQVDDIQTGSVTPDAAGASDDSQPTPAVAPPPKLLVGTAQNADADDTVAQTTINIAPRPGKAYVDRIPAEEDKPAGMQKPAVADAAEKVIAVEAVPDEESAVAAVTPAPDKVQKPKPHKTAATEANTASGNDLSAPLTGWSVQISSQKNEQVAWNVWKKLKAKHSILAEQKPVVMKADLGDRGIVYRLRLAGFDDQNSARDLCSKLKSRGVSCYVSRLDS